MIKEIRILEIDGILNKKMLINELSEYLLLAQHFDNRILIEITYLEIEEFG